MGKSNILNKIKELYKLNRKEINRCITEVMSDMDALIGTLAALNQVDPGKYPENYEILSMEACLRAERIACNIRHFIYTTASITKKDLMKLISQEHNVKIAKDDNYGALSITLPSLLPKKKQVNGGEFLLDALYFALQEFAEANGYTKFKECVVCFFHAYDKKISSQKIRDYDNIETKQVLDIIAAFTMTDDSGRYCDTYHTSISGEANFTEIVVVEKDKFLAWLSAEFHTVQNSPIEE